MTYDLDIIETDPGYSCDYRWTLSYNGVRVADSFAVSVRGARRAAKQAAKKHKRQQSGRYHVRETISV